MSPGASRGTKGLRRRKCAASAGGFSLLELLIVVAIILIVAAIAIPNLLRSRIAANQSSAVASIRTIITAENAYSCTYNTGYSPDLASLGPSGSGTDSRSGAGLIDSVLVSGTKSGYIFTYAKGDPDSTGHISAYTITAAPTTPVTGTNTYFADPSGLIRQNSSGTATSASPPIGD